MQLLRAYHTGSMAEQKVESQNHRLGPDRFLTVASGVTGVKFVCLEKSTAWVFRAGEQGTDSQQSGHDSSDKCELSKMTDSEEKENSCPPPHTQAKH